MFEECDGLCCLNDFKDKLPCNRDVWYRLMKRGDVPAPVFNNGRVYYWKKSDIRAFLNGEWKRGEVH